MLFSITLLLLTAADVGSPAAPPRPFSSEQIAALAKEALRHTPEHTHFAKGTHFAWVLFVAASVDPHPEVSAAIIEHLRAKYTVFRNESELPAGAVSTDGMGKAYQGGFVYSVNVNKLGSNLVEVSFRDFEASLAAGQQTIRYRWRGGKWVAVWKSPQLVS